MPARARPHPRMLRVRCQANVTIDAKGRLALPAPLRRALEEAGERGLVCAYHKGAVWAWTVADYEKRVEGPLAEADPFDAQVMDFAHALLSTAQDVELDGQGRIRIPPRLRELAGLDKDAVVHSIVDRIEIWDKDAWEQRFRQALERTADRSGMPGARLP